MVEENVKERIHALWDELAAFGAADADEAMTHLLQTLAPLTDAQQAFWMGAVRLKESPDSDPIGGWRPRTLRYLYRWSNEERHLKTQASLIESGQIDPSIVENLREAGRFRITIQHEMVSPEWFESEYYKTYFEPHNIRDFIYVVTPLGSDIESWLGFKRIADTRSFFSQEAREILDYAVRPLRWFHHEIALQHGLLLASQPLTTAERRALNGLLTSKSEQQIANELGLTQKTVHTYCMRICRKFGVRGRTGLAALWLGRAPR